MLEQRREQKESQMYQKTMLYRLVFCRTYSKFFTFVLFSFLLLQPFSPALAAFSQGESETSTDNPNSEVLQPEVIAPEVTQPDISQEPVLDAPIDESPQIDVPVQEQQKSTSTTFVSTEAETTSNSNSSSTPDSGTATSTQEVSSTTTPVLATTSPNQEVLEHEATTTESIVATSTPTTTPEVGEHSSAAFEFDKKECASVGDGAYYCSSTKKLADPMQDGVFSAPDAEGDLEIYVRLNGKEQILTTNSVDDSAPYYDALSERIVWHSLVHDRYQIISYNTKTDKKTTVTNTAYNNMEPVAFGDVTLWQAWILNNWEIMLNDGTSTVQLTHNGVQDVSPHMRGGYIVWQTQFSDGWKVAVYDQKTQTVEYIASEGGNKIENPRFVLVYDSTNGEGDVQTVGYDLDSKLSFKLGSLPAQLPDELPKPDQTGETRALIQAKQNAREGEQEVLDIPTPGSNATGTPATSTHAVPTLDLRGGVSTSTVITSTSSLPATDIIIPSYASTTSASQGIIAIPDVVIPPVTATTT